MKYLLLLVFIAYVIFLSFSSIAEFPSVKKSDSFLPYLADRPLTEDGFYSLKIAWNLGTGEGVTYNFNQPATGFQPLFVFVISFFAFLTSTFGGNKIDFLRIVILLSGFTAVIITYLFYVLIKKLEKGIDTKILFLVTILLVLFNFKLFLNLLNGLETGLYLLLMIISIIQTKRIVEGNKNIFQLILFGLILGLTILARNDFILIASIVILILNFSKSITFKDSIVIISILFLTILPWLMFIYSVQGSFIPTSAYVQTGFNSNELFYRIEQFFYSIFTYYIPFLHAGQTQSIVIYILAIALGVLLYKYKLMVIKKYFGLQVIKIWFIAIIVISVVYLFFASQPYFFFRYLSVHLVIAIPFLALFITKQLSNRLHKFKIIMVFTLIAIFVLNAGYYFHYPKKVSGLALRPDFIDKNNLSEEKIGMAQSGISGYFFDNIINLDGKVNGAALSAIKKNKLYNYIMDEKITVLIEWKEWFDLLPSEKLTEDWYPASYQIKDNKTLVLIRK